jgi:hypothetical protein
MLFRNKSLDAILSSFDRVAADLSKHVAKKSQEQFELMALRSEIDDEITETADEVDRAHRVLSKVRDLVA